MRAPAVFPCVPMTNENIFVNSACGFSLLDLIDSAGSLQSGKTSIVKAKYFPSRLMIKFPTSSSSSPFDKLMAGVICRASPPSMGIRQSCDEPEREEMKYTDFPSGAQQGLESASGWVVNWRRPAPSEPISQRSVRPLFASKSVFLRTKTIRLPSGETFGSEILSMANISWMEKG